MRIDIKLKPSAFHIDKKTDKAIKVHSWNFYSKIPKIKKHILEKLTDPSLIEYVLFNISGEIINYNYNKTKNIISVSFDWDGTDGIKPIHQVIKKNIENYTKTDLKKYIAFIINDEINGGPDTWMGNVLLYNSDTFLIEFDVKYMSSNLSISDDELQSYKALQQSLMSKHNRRMNLKGSRKKRSKRKRKSTLKKSTRKSTKKGKRKSTRKRKGKRKSTLKKSTQKGKRKSTQKGKRKSTQKGKRKGKRKSTRRK